MVWKRAIEVEPEIYDGESATTAIVMFSIFMMIVATFMGMWADYSGILRYVIMLTIVSLVLMIPAYFLFRSSAKSGIYAPEQREPVLKGNLEELKELVKRALRGYHASQVMLEDRLREDLIQRIAIRKRFRVESVRELSRDWNGAILLTGDDDLARLLSSRKTMGQDRKSMFVRPSKEYREWLMRVMEKMEEWK